MTATVGRARAAGAVGTLPHLLAGSAWQALHASRWDEAAADANEALELAEELGQPVTATQVLGVLTWIHALRGDEARCRAYGDETRRRARTFGFRLYELLVSVCFGVLDLGLGRVAEAIGHLEEAARYADERGLNIPGVAPQFDLAEACIRAGRAADAETILASFERSELVSAPFPEALAERCRGLIAEGDRFEEHFREALALHARIENPFALARTQLCYGERLRRARRRAEARTHLRAAHGVFERLGAQPWAAQRRGGARRIRLARRGVRASGARRADAARASCRVDRRLRRDEPGSRLPPVRHAQDRRVPPALDLPQARPPVALGADAALRRGTCRRRGRLTPAARG